MTGFPQTPSEVDNLDLAMNTSKEMMQEIILSALSKSGFFDVALFHGGTCLRIIHGLDRFSEDLDFTLIRNDGFDIAPYESAIVSELVSTGISAYTKVRQARGELPILSMKVNANQREVLSAFGFNESIVKKAHSKENITVKIDVDVTPPEYTRTEIVTKDGFRSYSIRVEPLPVLFAGKTSAVLCRRWGNRVKGRDMFDFRWYIENDIPIDIRCLSSKMDSKCIAGLDWDRETLIQRLEEKFDNLDWESAFLDIRGFAEKEQNKDDWSPEPFKVLARRIKVE